MPAQSGRLGDSRNPGDTGVGIGVATFYAWSNSIMNKFLNNGILIIKRKEK